MKLIRFVFVFLIIITAISFYPSKEVNAGCTLCNIDDNDRCMENQHGLLYCYKWPYFSNDPPCRAGASNCDET